jgi:hypothetical protein
MVIIFSFYVVKYTVGLGLARLNESTTWFRAGPSPVFTLRAGTTRPKIV